MVISSLVHLWGEAGVDNHVLEGEQDVGGVVGTSLALPAVIMTTLNMLRVWRSKGTWAVGRSWTFAPLRRTPRDRRGRGRGRGGWTWSRWTRAPTRRWRWSRRWWARGSWLRGKGRAPLVDKGSLLCSGTRCPNLFKTRC